MRRAERGLGLAIRKGQAEGTVRKQSDNPYTDPSLERGPDGTAIPKIQVRDLVDHSQERSEMYAVTDNVTDEQFEEAITEAREEQNLSRAIVVT